MTGDGTISDRASIGDRPTRLEVRHARRGRIIGSSAWPWSPSETFRLVFFCGIVVSMEGSNTFVREVIAALRPVLPAETLDHVSFSIETGQLHKALIEALGGAVKHEITVPARLIERVGERLADGVSFRPKDARALNRLLPRIRTDTGA